MVANNIFLSKSPVAINSEGIAFAHNLIVGGMRYSTDHRQTFYYKPHDSVSLGRHDNPAGDIRWLNNVVGGKISSVPSPPPLPVVFAGNVYINGASPSGAVEGGKSGDARADSAMVLPEAPAPVLEEKPDGWYLTSTQSTAWRDTSARALVTSSMLGKVVIPDCGFENVNGLPLEIDTDYFGCMRDTHNPFPGPFECVQSGGQAIKVWPKPMPR